MAPTGRQLKPFFALALVGALTAGMYHHFKTDTKQETHNQDTAPAPVYAGPPKPISAYGKTIYSKNSQAQNKLYIIGQLHEELDGSIGPNTSAVQRDIYRICEHLIRDNSIQLFIAEGNHVNKDLSSIVTETRSLFRADPNFIPKMSRILADDGTLEQFLSDRAGLFTADAQKLLYVMHPQTYLSGAENEKLHSDSIKIAEHPGFTPTAGQINELFDYLARARSVAILSNTPLVIAREYRAKNIQNRNAIMIIGDAHIDDMVKFVDTGEVALPSNPSLKLPAFEGKLRLNDYAVTVIRPISLRR